jgi:hypothetical protein
VSAALPDDEMPPTKRTESGDRMNFPRGLTAVVAALLAGLLVVGAGVAVSGPERWRGWWRLARDGRTVQGRVIGIESEGGTCRYEFKVDGRAYQAADKKCRLGMGDAITVTYDPNEPSLAIGRSPSGELFNQGIGLGMIALFAAISVGFQVWKRRDRR